MPENSTAEIVEALSNSSWRLNNLYHIKNKSGEVVVFKPNTVQQKLLENRHLRNVVPKARQHGITTCVCIHFLNSVITTPHQKAAIIAHRESDALKIFESKVKFPLEHIEEHFKIFLPKIKRLTSNTLELDNGSIITADTMVRSDTLNYLHVSELGKMAAWYPIKAEEVKTGAFPAAERGEIFVESTMEGNTGLMADLCETARNLSLTGATLTRKDFKFFFFPWWENDGYAMPERVELTNADNEYFVNLAKEDNIFLTVEQKNWYVKERSILGDKMRQEFPSTFEESIEASVEGAFFRKQIAELRAERRFCRVPYDSHVRTYAAFDIGRNDATAITVFQVSGKEIRIINYCEHNREDPDYYAQWLTSLPYPIDRVFLPHDAGSESIQTSRTYEDIFREDFKFKTKLLKRDTHEILGIDLAKRYFNRCWIDSDSCGRLVECLTLFSKEFNRRFGTWTTKSRHDEYSDGAKSFIYAMQGVNSLEGASEDEYAPGEIARLKHKPVFY